MYTAGVGGRHPYQTLEIERVFLLRNPPEIPLAAQELRIEQGYLPEGAAGGSDGAPLEGRLRCTTMPDGSTIYHHTVKRGEGLVREETEREIPRAEFERDWPRTHPLRIAKTRYRVRESELVWEVDVFDRPQGLVLAEVELPSADAKIVMPHWIARSLLREVTDDPAYTNRAIAMRLLRSGGEATM